MRRLPILSSMLYLPLERISDAESLKRELTLEINPVPGQRVENMYVPALVGGDETITVRLFDDSKKGYIGVPRRFGLDRFPDVRFVDRCARGRASKRISAKIKPKNKAQKKFMRELANVCKDLPADYLANAKTGSGKTVCDLWLTAKLGVPCLVVVHTNRLKEQWLARIEQFFGKAFRKKYVGIAQQDVCDFDNRLIVVGLLPSLARRRYPASFYRHFGKVTFDEVHKCSAPLMSEVFKKLPAAVRGGYTATNRDDALRKVCDYHIGRPRVVSTQRVLTPTVFVRRYSAQHSLNDYNEYSLITSLSQLLRRNIMLGNILIKRGWNRGRHAVALSDRTHQLVWMRQYLIDNGVPEDKIGLYVGAYPTGKWKSTLRVDGKLIAGWKEDTKKQAEQKAEKYATENNLRKTGRVVIKVTEEKIKPTKQEYEHMERHSQIFLVTYGIFAEGMDIPRLDMGVELTPRAKVIQPVGRILREHEGKQRPEWYGIEDDIRTAGNGFSRPKTYGQLTRWSEARLKSYEEQQAEVRYIR